MNDEKLSILYQDHHLLIVNKPANLVIHPTYKHADGTLWNAILAYANEQGVDDWRPPELPDEPEWAGAPEHIQAMLREQRSQRMWQEEGLLPRPCLLHRLDKDTSGVVALARTERARKHLIRQFNEHTIVKRYLAVVSPGRPEWAEPRARFRATRKLQPKRAEELRLPVDLYHYQGEELVLNGPLQRDPDDRRRCIVGPDGQEAETIIRVLQACGDFALIEAQPVTGRTHQIRAHLAALGYPIVGDATYARSDSQSMANKALQRQFLHAYCLELRRYPDNEWCRFIAPLPDDLMDWLRNYFPEGLDTVHAAVPVSP
jgi:23S rRNA-/tRNA-specific pseudouridylate synthase